MVFECVSEGIELIRVMSSVCTVFEYVLHSVCTVFEYLHVLYSNICMYCIQINTTCNILKYININI